MCIGWETFIQVPYWKAASTVALDVPDNTFEDSWNIFKPEKLWYPPPTHTHCCTPTHPKPLAFGLLRHLSCELKIDDPNPCWFLSSMLSTGFTLIHASLFGSLKEMKIAVLCSPGRTGLGRWLSSKCLWLLVVNLFKENVYLFKHFKYSLNVHSSQFKTYKRVLQWNTSLCFFP